uniref:Ig-like domain-containing protein n=1 Tax=Neogobius melanostomus TaxID=47308 RepID=A0A8C6U3J5_9GOBI
RVWKRPLTRSPSNMDYYFLPAIPITFVQPLKSIQADEGTNVVLRCELSKPGVPVQWWKEDEILRNGYQIRKKELWLELRIMKADIDDGGEYACICGDQRTIAIITVNGESICNFPLRQSYRYFLNSVKSHHRVSVSNYVWRQCSLIISKQTEEYPTELCTYFKHLYLICSLDDCVISCRVASYIYKRVGEFGGERRRQCCSVLRAFKARCVCGLEKRQGCTQAWIQV